MRLLSIELKNFRGAKSTKLDIAGGAPGKIVTLIGLNESGKTTIIEGISNFVSLDPDTRGFVETLLTPPVPKTFIPKDKRGRFTGDIRIKARVEIGEADFVHLKAELQKQGIKLLDFKTPFTISVEKAFLFEDSELKKTQNYWSLWDYKFTIGNGKKINEKPPTGPDKYWHAIVNVMNGMLPKVVYFPTFLFSIPTRIYLAEHENETPQNVYYRKILDNALQAVDKKYSIKKHITDRVRSIISRGGVSLLSDSEETSEIDSTVRDLANELTRVIMGAWNEIIGVKTSNQRIEIKWTVDQSKGDLVYLEMALISGERRYLLEERSLGFRWFFSFLLFTQFRYIDSGGRGTIYLFDEPASNLHSSAQISLLASFEKIMGANDYIIYSTHSHYMINPLWLEKAYIVHNQSVPLDANEFDIIGPTNNDIKAVSYKNFVADNPTRLTYFQPVLDALRYKLSPLTLDGPAVILEGKFDYYPFRYLLSRSKVDYNIKCYSANGASEMGVLLSLFRGLEVPFIILLDADKQGVLEKKRYFKDYLLSSSQIMTLDEADKSFAGESFEFMYKSDVKALISESSFSGGGRLKAQGSAIFQLLYASRDFEVPMGETLEVFNKILNEIEVRLAAQVEYS